MQDVALDPVPIYREGGLAVKLYFYFVLVVLCFSFFQAIRAIRRLWVGATSAKFKDVALKLSSDLQSMRRLAVAISLAAFFEFFHSFVRMLSWGQSSRRPEDYWLAALIQGAVLASLGLAVASFVYLLASVLNAIVVRRLTASE